MPQLHIRAAYDYYDKHINRTERFDLLQEHNFPIPGSVPSIDWELFGALLTGDERKVTGYGSDLKTFEVKSAVEGGSFEYQYHKHGGVAKLDEDKIVDHIFITYSRGYQDVTVRLVKGSELAPRFEGWRPALIKAYRGQDDDDQRFRRSVALGYVRKNGLTVMTITGGKLVQADPEPAASPSPASAD